MLKDDVVSEKHIGSLYFAEGGEQFPTSNDRGQYLIASDQYFYSSKMPEKEYMETS